jgi:hypothetical protein
MNRSKQSVSFLAFAASNLFFFSFSFNYYRKNYS